MTLRLALVIDGNAEGARKAAEETQRAVGGLGRQSGTAAQGMRRTSAEAAGLTRANQGLAASFRNAAGSVAVMHGPLGGIASRLSATGMLVGRMGLAMGGLAIGIGGVTFAAQRGVRAFAEYERAQLTTQQVIRATGGAAGRTAQDIETLSREIGLGTLASTTGVRQAAQQLLTFRTIAGETFDDTLRLAQDLAAVGFGTVASSAVQLAKAMEDPEQGLTALRRVGISFTATQRELIRNFNETGRTAEAQREILKAVEQQVGGAGAAAAGGLSGAFDTLVENTGRWFELIGGGIADITNLAGGLQAVADGVGAVNDAMSSEGGMNGFLADARQEIDQIEAAQKALQTGLRLPGADAQIREWERQKEAIQANIDEVERFGRAQRQSIDVRSRKAAEEIAQGRIDGVVKGLEEEAAALRRTEVAQAQLDAVKKAGVALNSEAGQVIAGLVARNHAFAEAQTRAAQAGEAAQAAWESGRQSVGDLTGALQIELDMLRATDPVMREMIGLRDTLAFATAEEEAAVRGLITAREREAAAIDRLDDHRAVARGFFQDMRSGFQEGASIADTFANALVRVADRLAELATNDLLDVLLGKQGSSGTGIFGTLLGSVAGSLFGGGAPTNIVPSALGNVFSAGHVHAFGLGGVLGGGVVDRPTFFPMANGAGLMGEAGPEAIMPLKRGAGGRLGVEASGGGSPVVIHYSPQIDARGADREGMARIEAQMARDRRDMPRVALQAVREAQSRREQGFS
ncbi:MAG: phage tail length tape measure family protein [Gammaproteobacteria bacterium]